MSISSDFLASIADDVISAPLLIPGRPETRGRPRELFEDRAATNQELKARARSQRASNRSDCIAILDMETDPFDNVTKADVFPFTACLYSENFPPINIWEEDLDKFVDAVLEAIESLPDSYTIYAHNGGKFDYMFLIHKIKGKVSFKGRGIMSCKIGNHELRDSMHILPEKLAAYHKEEFDYSKNLKHRRKDHKQEILDYQLSDCVYLYDLVKGFIERFGFKISIGQAAMAELRKVYKVGRIGAKVDETLRQYFFGGRVECLAGRGHFKGKYKLYDVNSMYPAVMAKYKHPIGAQYIRREKGGIGPDTFFIDLTCTNDGALVRRAENNETTAGVKHGRFMTTIWEYNAALELGLIRNIKIHAVIDCPEKSDFSLFINPLADEKAALKIKIDAMTAAGDTNSREYFEAKKQYTYSKFLQNNSYGKFAQNPRNYKESYITGPDNKCPEGFEEFCVLPNFRNSLYAIWERPAPVKGFNNVGTAASITGAARADLMRAIHGAVDPIYCDTDSLICKSISGVEIHKSKLGAWDLEAEFDEVIIAGKKLYACKTYSTDYGQKDKIKIRSKGASGLTWPDMLELLDGETVTTTNNGPTLTKTGRQFYMTRKIRATAAAPKDKVVFDYHEIHGRRQQKA